MHLKIGSFVVILNAVFNLLDFEDYISLSIRPMYLHLAVSVLACLFFNQSGPQRPLGAVAGAA